MAREAEARVQHGALTEEEAEELFKTVDETGHTNEERARRERRHRQKKGVSVVVDPLSGSDPSGSDVEKRITRAAVGISLLIVVAVVLGQVLYSTVRRLATESLAEHATVRTVASALHTGVEWGDGFTSFPEDFSVLEADENTGRIEVTVVDTKSTTLLECFSSAQIQATAFCVNALLNPRIDTVTYHVNVHMGDDGVIQTTRLFGFLKPTGNITQLMTFTWSKTQTATGVNFTCTITGLDADMQETLRDQVTTGFTPVAL